MHCAVHIPLEGGIQVSEESPMLRGRSLGEGALGEILIFCLFYTQKHPLPKGSGCFLHIFQNFFCRIGKILPACFTQLLHRAVAPCHRNALEARICGKEHIGVPIPHKEDLLR